MLQPKLLLTGCDGVVPFTVKALGGEVDLSHLLVTDFLSSGIDVEINFGFHSQTLRRLGRFDEVHNDFMADQGLSTPVHANKGKQPVFDLVPFASCRW